MFLNGSITVEAWMQNKWFLFREIRSNHIDFMRNITNCTNDSLGQEQHEGFHSNNQNEKVWCLLGQQREQRKKRREEVMDSLTSFRRKV